MVQKMTKRTRVTLKAVLLVVAALIATILLMQVLSPKEQDPFKESNTAQTDAEKKSEPSTPPQPEKKPSEGEERGGAFDPNANPLDPANLTTIDVPGLNVTVTYVRGIGGFEYEIMRTPNGTQYVEFRSASLVGTKCTNDKGAFASILANPQSAEQATLAKTVKVDGALYGLSLPTASCTSNEQGLAAYQQSFSDAFSLLKKTN